MGYALTLCGDFQRAGPVSLAHHDGSGHFDLVRSPDVTSLLTGQ